jgi:NAD(P)H-dependent FMN reductase
MVIVASTRPGRVGLPIGQWFCERVAEHGAFAVDLADLAEINLPFFDEPLHPRLRQYSHQHTRDWSARVEAADAFVWVTPEYNHSFNAPLKNAIDYLHQEWQHKPVGFISYGGVSAGTRAVQMLKSIAAVLKLVPAVANIVIPNVGRLFDDERTFQADESLERAATTLLTELQGWEAALRSMRTSIHASA